MTLQETWFCEESYLPDVKKKVRIINNKDAEVESAGVAIPDVYLELGLNHYLY